MNRSTQTSCVLEVRLTNGDKGSTDSEAETGATKETESPTAADFAVGLPTFRYSFGLPPTTEVRQMDNQVILMESNEQRRSRVESLFKFTKTVLSTRPPRSPEQVVPERESGGADEAQRRAQEVADIKESLASSEDEENAGYTSCQEREVHQSVPVIPVGPSGDTSSGFLLGPNPEMNDPLYDLVSEESSDELTDETKEGELTG